MSLPVGMAARLHTLAGADDPGQLAAGLDGLLVLAIQGVPSCVGVSLTLTRNGLPLTVTALAPIAGLDQVRGSLALRLPAAHGGNADGATLLLYASLDGAFDLAAMDLLLLLDLEPVRVTLDGHLQLPDVAAAPDVLTGHLDDLSVVDRALGVLLERGFLPADAHLELDRLALACGSTVPAVARAVLAALPPAT